MLTKNSIYRGKAIEADFEVVDPRNFKFDPTKAPTFWDTTGTRIEDIILPDEVFDLVQTSVWTPIERSQLCRTHKIPLRRGILLAGSYGVGKTLAARITAKLCEENGWTFLYLKNLKQLEQALKFAKRYEPCVVFAEDVNRIVSGERTQEMDDLFNLIDGVDRKNDEVMVVFTTNNIEQIHAGMLRPGRIDSVVTVTPPDSKAVQRLVKLYGREILDPAADLSVVGEMLAGQIPAIIRETVERSKLAAIKDAKPNEPLQVKSEHLISAARQMLVHAGLLLEPPKDKPDLVVLGNAIGSVIRSGMREELRGVDEAPYESELNVGVSAMLDQAGRPNGKHAQK
jgi:transitional endoplasmic reticulum ATPase